MLAAHTSRSLVSFGVAILDNLDVACGVLAMTRAIDSTTPIPLKSAAPRGRRRGTLGYVGGPSSMNKQRNESVITFVVVHDVPSSGDMLRLT